MSNFILNKLYPLGFKNDFKIMTKTALPLILSSYGPFCLTIVSLIYCGQIGKNELDAVSLSISVYDIFGLACVMGLSSACETLFPQLFSSNNKQEMGVILQKGILISTFASFPCVGLMFNCKNVLNALKLDKVVTELVEKYVFVLFPSIWFIGISVILNKYVQSQDIVYPVMIINFVVNVLNVGFHQIFVSVLNLGVQGAGISVTLSNALTTIFLIVYIYFSKLYLSTWSGWSWKCLDDWSGYLKLAIPGYIMLVMEWLTFEIGSFLSTLLGTVQIGAQSICLQLSIFVFMIPLGLSIAGNIHIGHYLGSNKPENAKNASRVIATMALTTGAVICLFLITITKYIPLIFTKNNEIINLAGKALILVAVLHILDAAQATASGIIKSIGGQKWGSIMNIIGFYVFGLPLGLSLMLKTSLQLYGFWIGLIVGDLVLIAMQIVYVYRIDWIEEAQKVSKLVSNDENASISSTISNIFSEKSFDYKISFNKKIFLIRLATFIFMILLMVLGLFTRNF